MIYSLNVSDDFELKDIFECGQCFRWNLENDGTYTGIIHNLVLNVDKQGSKIIFKSNCNNKKELEKVINDYFDLDRNYKAERNKIARIDQYLKEATKYGKGIRILNQDLWETIISFIISANNNIPRIKKIIEELSKRYGSKISFDGKTYYSFPTPKQLSKASVQDLRNVGLGFRDKRIYETTKFINENKNFLEKLKKEDTKVVKEKLLELSGVGPKVADCILLFSELKRFDVFPIDVWVRRVMNELYIHNKDENKVSKKQIEDLEEEKIKDKKGLAQKYLFYWRREQ